MRYGLNLVGTAYLMMRGECICCRNVHKMHLHGPVPAGSFSVSEIILNELVIAVNVSEKVAKV